MQFRCERDSLADVVGTAQRAVGSRGGALPVLSGLLIEMKDDQIEVTGTDLELTVKATAAVQGEGVGTAVLPARLFGDIIRSLEPGVVQVEVGDEEARISAGRSEFTVRVLPAGDFPRSKPATEGGMPISGQAFSEALRQVVPTASRDDARPILTGVLLAAEGQGLRLVATDSYRLAVRDLPSEHPLEADQQVLIPARALGELQRVLGQDSAKLYLSDRDASFEVGGTRITTRLIEGQFPNYRQLLPQGYPNRLTAQREALIEAVRRVRLVTQGRENTPVRISMRSDGVDLDVDAHEVGHAHEALDAKFEGTEMVVAFNPEFLIDGLQAITGPEVVIETLDPLKPVTARSVEGDGFIYLLMPVRVP